MEIQLHNTSRIVEVDGVPCRVWEGHTSTGIEVAACICRVAAGANQDLSQFEAELKEQRTPTAIGMDSFPLRMVL